MARMKQDQREQAMKQTRQRLLDVAAERFARAGYAGANINSISTAAGFAKGTIYNYFPSKQALLLALLDATAEQHIEFIASRVRPEPDPARRLALFYRFGFDFVGENLDRAHVVFTAVNGADEQLKTHVFAAYQPMFKFLADEILTPGIAQGVFKPSDPTATALLLMTIYLGTASQHDATGHPWLDPAQVAGLVLDGLR